MNSRWIFVCMAFLVLNASAMARECKSCQEHRNGGSITYGNIYAPGGVYQPGGTYYPGGVYPSYGYSHVSIQQAISEAMALSHRPVAQVVSAVIEIYRAVAA